MEKLTLEVVKFNENVFRNGNEYEYEMHESEQTITSLEIAELTGKQHNDVLKAIRKMEPAWVKIAQGNFSLGSYKDANGQLRPCYVLTKTECLYIATKFNDEARAKLVLRWEELEKAEVRRKKEVMRQLGEKADYCDEVLRSTDCLSTRKVANEMQMSAMELYDFLRETRVLYKQGGEYLLYADFARLGLAKTITKVHYDPLSNPHVRRYPVWTEKGRCFLHLWKDKRYLKWLMFDC